MKMIKQKLAILALSLFCMSNAYSAEPLDFCTEQSKLAESIMKARQAGAPVTKVIAVIKKATEMQEAEAQAIVLIEMAYAHPKFNMQSNRDEAAVEFSNKVYLLCKKHT